MKDTDTAMLVEANTSNLAFAYEKDYPDVLVIHGYVLNSKRMAHISDFSSTSLFGPKRLNNLRIDPEYIYIFVVV